MRSLPYMPQLDALRAIAALMVVHSHLAPVSLFAMGHFAVKLFFVLSGFLVTRILLRQRDDPRPVASRWRAFALRRAARLFPLYYLVLISANLMFPTLRSDFSWHALYVGNHAPRVAGEVPITRVFWTLSVEEQFYLVWPLVILLLPLRWLPWVLVALVPVEIAARYALLAHGRAPVWTVAQVGLLAVGALLGLAWERGTFRWRPALHVAGLVGGAATVWLVERGAHPNDPQMVLPIAVAFVAVVDKVACGVGGPVGRLLSSRPLRYLGQISYGVYVLHGFVMPVVVLSTGIRLSHDGRAASWAAFVLVVVLTLVLASASRELLERPIQAWATRDDRRALPSK